MISVVVPLLNEEKNVDALVERVHDALEGGRAWELILVDDGSEDRTAAIVMRLADEDARIRLVRLAVRYGQSTAMQAGFDHVRGDVVVTMDGDMQNDPRDIPALVSRLREGYDLVAGYRLHRKDRLVTRRIPSWVANRIIHWITGVSIRDNGCSLKAYRRELLDNMRLYSEMHRFIPAMAAGMAGARIAEIPVRHHPRRYGTSKYGFSRVFRVLADLVTIKMIRTFRVRPLRLFSALATASAGMGLLFSISAVVVQLTWARADTLWYVFPATGMLWFALAAFLLLLGLVGEVALRQHTANGRRVRPLVREIG